MNCFLSEPMSSWAAAWASQDQYRSALQGYLVRLPEGPAIDFRSVALAADAVHKRTSGCVSPRAFLTRRRAELGDRAPIDLISEPDGPERIRALALAVAAEFA